MDDAGRLPAWRRIHGSVGASAVVTRDLAAFTIAWAIPSGNREDGPVTWDQSMIALFVARIAAKGST